tara:strand:- start:1335 stop:1958 length:624 start_codon:yes stop_codon:yes gene_type:complete
MKFRVIQSNNRGLISKVGDKTFYSRKPKIGEEIKELPTLFIWVNLQLRYAARAWTKWTGEKINKDFIYEVTKFRNIIDISGKNYFHQWSNQDLRVKLWKMKGKEINITNINCPKPEQVWEENRNKRLMYLKVRNNLIRLQYKDLSENEKALINNLYREKNRLNLEAGFIKYHIDHIKPLSKGGLHEYRNLRIITAYENQIKGSKIIY